MESASMAGAERVGDMLLLQGSHIQCSVCLELAIDGGQRSIASSSAVIIFTL
jgi:hypothetical protein